MLSFFTDLLPVSREWIERSVHHLKISGVLTPSKAKLFVITYAEAMDSPSPLV